MRAVSPPPGDRMASSVEAHAAVFSRVLELLGASGLLSGKTLGVDATTLRGLRSIEEE